VTGPIVFQDGKVTTDSRQNQVRIPILIEVDCCQSTSVSRSSFSEREVDATKDRFIDEGLGLCDQDIGAAGNTEQRTS